MSERSILASLLPVMPPSGATRADKLAWTRRVYLRILPLMVVVYALIAIVGAPRWLWVVIIVGAGTWLCGFAQVNLEIWRGSQHPSGPSRPG